ncbi:MAG: hypothetical protein VW450_02335 [Chloroflexota bacterium]
MSAASRSLTLGRRIYRAVFFGLLVGLTGTAVAVLPALFVQSAFVQDTERCERQQQADLESSGQVQTDCAELLAETPVWLPPVILAAGALVGVLGGGAYGFIAPQSAGRASVQPGGRWLPF